MNKPMEFKVAFQGGGAKFVTLLAAVDALSLAQKNKKILFSHIIGSSAGGLAATLLGLESNISTLRATLQKEEVRNRLRKITIEKADLSSLWKIFRGKPLIDEKHLHDLFSEILISVTGGDLDHTPDIKTKTSLVITNIRTSTSEIVDINGMKIRDIADNLVNTCAIPFVLRGFGAARNAHLVDGGLFENFPTSALTQDDYPNRRIIGVTFKKSTPEVNVPSWGLLSYASHIISAAIDSNIEPSLKSLHQQNVIHLPNSWGTFDFKGALDSIGDKSDSHESVREMVNVSLAEILLRERQVANLTKIKEKASVPQNYDQVRDSSALLFSHRSSSGMSKRCYIYLECKSLQLDTRTASLGKEDYYFQKVYYTVPPEGIECVNIVINEFIDEGEFSLFADFSITDERGNNISHVVLPLKRIVESKNYRSIGIFFDKRIFPSDSKEICLIQRELLPDQFEEIKSRGWDYLEIASLQNGRFEEVEIHIGVPKHLRDDILVEVAKRQYDLDSEVGKLISGSAIRDSAEVRDAVNPGYITYGFKANSVVEGDKLFSVLIADKRVLPKFNEFELFPSK